MLYVHVSLSLPRSPHSSSQDLNRQVVRADSASLSIPELDFEVPANTQEGSLSTVEGIVTRAVEGLEQDQPLRRVSGWVEGE